MDYEHIRVATDGAVATITISREQVRNALSQATTNEIFAALQALEADLAIRAIVVTGAGERAFVAGADINELRALG
ncbi:MAG TPA: enoyl-CoA hydratase-related protein, partial [Roseiflexaceae bacterium]|nr:enoyl-CoA hydratase-related protein [Roseiflexaceae bacterium]